MDFPDRRRPVQGDDGDLEAQLNDLAGCSFLIAKPLQEKEEQPASKICRQLTPSIVNLLIAAIGLFVAVVITFRCVHVVRCGPEHSSVWHSVLSIRDVVLDTVAVARRSRKWDMAMTIVLSLTTLFSLAFSIYAYLRRKSKVDTLWHYRQSKIALGLHATCMTLALLRAGLDEHGTCPDLQLNPDIGGTGVLVGIYAPIALTFVSLLGGMYYDGDTGTKELGIAMFMNLVYLTFNLAKAQYTVEDLQKLSIADLLVVFATMDASSSGISMTFSNKHVLAARTYVRLCCLLQLVALLVLATTVGRTLCLWSGSQECCTQQIWWTQWSSCDFQISNLLPIVVYIALGFVRLVHRCLDAFSLSTAYDTAKKDPESWFAGATATVMHRFWEDVAGVVVSSTSLLLMLKRLRLFGAGKCSDWGQSATLIACLVGIGHWIYVTTPATVRQLQHLDKIITSRRNRNAAFELLNGLRLLALKSEGLRRHLVTRAKAGVRSGRPREEAPRTAEEMLRDLRLSARLGDLTGVKRLIEEGAPINGHDEGITALCDAVYNGHPAVVKYLLGEGAVQRVSDSSNRSYWSAMDFALREEPDHEVLDILLEHMEHHNLRSDLLWSGLRADIPLVSAIELGDVTAVGKLLLHGAPGLNIKHGAAHALRTYRATLPLVHATSQSNLAIISGICAFLETLDEFASKSNALSDALQACAEQGSYEAANLLLKLNADPHARDYDWNTPLLLAISSGDHRLISLLAPISDLEAQNKELNIKLKESEDVGHDVFQLFRCRKGHIFLIPAEVEGGMNLRQINCGRSALDIAVNNGDHEAVQILVDNGACVLGSAANNFDNSTAPSTPIAQAAFRGDRQILETLLRAADPRPEASVDTLSVLLPLPVELLPLLPPECARTVPRWEAQSLLWRIRNDGSDPLASLRKPKDDLYRLNIPRRIQPNKVLDTADRRIPAPATTGRLGRPNRPWSVDTIDIRTPFTTIGQPGRSVIVLHERDWWRQARTFARLHPSQWFLELQSFSLEAKARYLRKLGGCEDACEPPRLLSRNDEADPPPPVFGSGTIRTMSQFVRSYTVAEGAFEANTADIARVNAETERSLRAILAI